MAAILKALKLPIDRRELGRRRRLQGLRCDHTLNTVAANKTRNPCLILFDGATTIEGGTSGIRLAAVTNLVHSYDVESKKWSSAGITSSVAMNALYVAYYLLYKMNLSSKLFSKNKDEKLNIPNKVSASNPNAAKFVPSASILQFGNANDADVTRLDAPGPSKAVLDRTGSKILNNSDEEAHQFWWHHIPDDITPDFTSMGEEELYTPGQLSLDSLSLHEKVDASRFPASEKNQLFGTRQDVSSYGISNRNSREKVEYLLSTFMEDQSPNSIMKFSTTEWDKQFVSGGDHFTNTKDDYHYNEDPTTGLLTDLISEYASLEDVGINPVDFLISQFPGFSSESLADVYYANGCDLNSTIEIVTQLELQVDTGFNQNMNSKALEVPSFNVLDFPSISAADTQNGMSKFNRGDLLQTSNLFRFSSISKGTTNFASAVHTLATQYSAHQKYERSRPADGNIGSSKSSNVLASYGGHGKLDYGDKVHSYATVWAASIWLETMDRG